MADVVQERNYQLWNETGLKNIKPESIRYGEFPEGWNIHEELNTLIDPGIQLPAPDQRYVGFFLERIGFETDRFRNLIYNISRKLIR